KKPHEAAAALLAARSASPDDIELTANAADMLAEIGRGDDAGELDALLLESDPFRPQYKRHVAWLKKTEDHQSLAALMLRRAQKQTGTEAAESYLEAASAFRLAGADERAMLCEEQAFDSAPGNDEAFEA